MSLLHKSNQKITIKFDRHKFSRQLLDSKPLLDKPIKKITFKMGNHKFVRQFPDLKEVDKRIKLVEGYTKMYLYANKKMLRTSEC
uniref:Uncharacterized protein n=1 Tax=Solanum lycopersicum TaxID=4081 RepID=A0A3Q7J6K8_SOLLC